MGWKPGARVPGGPWAAGVRRTGLGRGVEPAVGLTRVTPWEGSWKRRTLRSQPA